VIGVTFAMGCKLLFKDSVPLVRRNQLTPASLLHTRIYVTRAKGDVAPG
jgi:hypothetical protein